MVDRNLLLQMHEGIALVTLNRPEKLNVLSRATMEELASVVDELETNEAVHALILTGAGKRAFSAGADIGELNALAGAMEGARFATWGQEILRKIEGLSKPVIAAINGLALGGGCELALACDIRIATESASLGQPEVNLGLIPGWGGTQRLPRLVGRGRAAWLILTGEAISAREALRIGLVDFVVPAGELMYRAEALAKTIGSRSPLAIAWAKRSINVGAETDLTTALAYEASQFGLVCGTRDRVEGTQAFLEKRPPKFRGV
jgi:enoyl-CoA hydratase